MANIDFRIVLFLFSDKPYMPAWTPLPETHCPLISNGSSLLYIRNRPRSFSSSAFFQRPLRLLPQEGEERSPGASLELVKRPSSPSSLLVRFHSLVLGHSTRCILPTLLHNFVAPSRHPFFWFTTEDYNCSYCNSKHPWDRPFPCGPPVIPSLAYSCSFCSTLREFTFLFVFILPASESCET